MSVKRLLEKNGVRVEKNPGVLEMLTFALSEGLSNEQFEAALQSSNFDGSENLLLFWLDDKQRLMDATAHDLIWDNRLEKCSWRVDRRATSKIGGDLNDSVALLEISSKPGHITKQSISQDGHQKQNVARFEMTRVQLGEMIANLDAIEKKLDEISAVV